MPAAWFVRANSGVGIVVVLDEFSNTIELKFSLLYTPFTIFRYRFITIGMICEQSSNVPGMGQSILTSTFVLPVILGIVAR